jgi:hypothetical protein
MAYDDLKEYNGGTYTGMAVGGEHAWIYPNGLWHEEKIAPDRWEFTFSSLKERERSAPVGSGVPVGTQPPCAPAGQENRCRQLHHLHDGRQVQTRSQETALAKMEFRISGSAVGK